jgi:hypothetical protein
MFTFAVGSQRMKSMLIIPAAHNADGTVLHCGWHQKPCGDTHITAHFLPLSNTPIVSLQLLLHCTNDPFLRHQQTALSPSQSQAKVLIGSGEFREPKSTSPYLLAIPAFDRKAGLNNRHLNSNRGICLR